MLSAQELSAPLAANTVTIAGFLLNTWLKATVLLGAAGLLAAMLKRAPASTRHAVWAIALSGLLTLPVLSLVLPSVNVPLLHQPVSSELRGTSQGGDRGKSGEIEQAAQAPAPLLAQSSEAPVQTRAAAGLRPGAPSAKSLAQPRSDPDEPSQQVAGGMQAWKPQKNRASWGSMLLLVWLAGFLVSLSRLIAGIFGAWRIARRCRPIAAADCVAELAELSASLGLDRRVRLLEHQDGSMPMTCGIVRPAIILPRTHCEWTSERRSIVLLHELSHVKRRDCLAQSLAQIVCAFYWLNPLVWLAARRLRLEGESACDDAVIGGGTGASVYARHLLDMARSLTLTDPARRGALTMARPSQLESRLQSILSPHRRRGEKDARAQSALASIGLLSIALVLATLSPYPRKTAAEGKLETVVEERITRGDSVQIASVAPGDKTGPGSTAPAQSPSQPTSLPVDPEQNSAAAPQDPRSESSSQSPVESDSAAISPRIADHPGSQSPDNSYNQEGNQPQAKEQAKSDAGIQALTGALKDKDPEVRASAIWALALHGGRASQDVLIPALKDDDPHVRSQAAWGLGLHGDKRAVEPLISALKDRHGQVRSQAAWALGLKGDSRAVEPLISALKDEQPQVKSQAAWALGLKGDARAVDALKSLLGDPANQVRRQAAWALGMLLMKAGGGDGDEDEEESDGETGAAPRPRPHPRPHPHIASAERRPN